MSPQLAEFLAHELAAPVAAPIRQAVRSLATGAGARAALFYGSVLRTGDLTGVADIYLLTEGPRRRGLRGLAERWLWPEVSYHEVPVEGAILRAKVATLPLATFRAAAGGRSLDTTIWTRFVQPAALVWSADRQARDEAAASVAAACETASRYAAALGPAEGEPQAFWTALFRQTYAAELRIEPVGREAQILAFDAARYDALLPIAWQSGGTAFARNGRVLRPHLERAERRRLLAAWARRRRLGKALNAARLAKAAFTFEGAARYAAWKIERHTGVHVPLTPWRERHPILAAPGVAWRLWRARRQAEAR